jgi:hypothetical protein
MAMGITATGIMSTTPTKVAFPAWWVASLGLILLALGAPMLVGRLMLLPGDGTREGLLQWRPVTSSVLESFEASRSRVVGWFPVNTVTGDMSMASFSKGMMARKTEERDIYLKDAEYWQHRALSISPADAYGWLRLAFVYQAVDGVSLRVAEALRQSIASAPFEPRLMAARVHLAVRQDRFLDPDVKRRLPFMIREAFAADEEALVRLAKKEQFIALVDQALADDSEALARFHEDLKQVD